MEATLFQSSSTVVYLPGLFGGGWAWEQVVGLVNTSDYVVVQEPLCALGRSPEKLLEELEPILQEISGQVTLVGTSYGGLLGMMMAANHPDRVERVVIADSAGFNYAETGFKLDRHNIAQWAQNLADVIYFDLSKVRRIDVERGIRDGQSHLRSIAALMNAANKHLDGEKYLARLQELEIPVHAIWGAEDTITPLSMAELALRRHGATIDVIPNSGHSPMCETPAEFAACLNRFVVRDPVGLQLAVQGRS